jgi:hypothetical protein
VVARLAFRRLIAANRRGELRRIAAQKPDPDAPAAGVATGRQAIREICARRDDYRLPQLLRGWPASTPATVGRNSARPGYGLASRWSCFGFVPIYLAIAENPFLERHVRVQTELGHHVITTGPYRVVRHPMYSGLMLLLPGCALVLGSAWSFAPITMLMATFIVRTVLEDGALWSELPGYKEYCTRTRYRLVPGVW